MENTPIKNEEPKSTVFDQMKEDALLGLVEGLLPKLKPFIEPAMMKLEDYFGDDEKIFIIRRSKNSRAKVIVLDNTKGEGYNIANEISEDGVVTKKFECDPTSVIQVYDTGIFVQKLLSGEFTTPK